MNMQNFEEIPNNRDEFDKTDPATNDPIVNLAPSSEKTAQDRAVIQEVPFSAAASSQASVDNPIVPASPLDETMPHQANASPEAASLAHLLKPEDSGHFRTRWNEIQGKFVDEPRVAVEQADALVSEVLKQIIQIFADQHGTLESQWKQGNNVSTEDLRMALQHYRSFFNRLVVS